MRRGFVWFTLLVVALEVLFAFIWRDGLWSLVVLGPVLIAGWIDFFQPWHAVLRNFPFLGHFRYWLEKIRPEIRQYFIESDWDGVPFNRDTRSLIYQRAKMQLETRAFGSQKNVYEVGYEWVNQSIVPVEVDYRALRVTVGGKSCKQPYSSSILNVSAMSFGALSHAAVEAMNGGAQLGGFAHNTGEGGISPYHLGPGGDLIFQFGTGYFGCRTPEGDFSPERFAEQAQIPAVKMIEVKISQGAKPGHGGILPGRKVTPEIARVRGISPWETCVSPPAHRAFRTPIELCNFIGQLRELSGGKPVGFKICVGKRREFIAICKAIVETGIAPDFVTVDGGEGGTGAAPLEFADHVGCPGREGLIFVHNVLVGFDLRKEVKVIAAGKVTNGFELISRVAIGADLCYSARGMMMATGCIQARKCNENICPVGVATQNRHLVAGLSVKNKRQRVAQFHRQTVISVAEILGSMGLHHTDRLQPWHLARRTGPYEIRHYGEIYNYLKEGELLREPLPKEYARACQAALSQSFTHVDQWTGEPEPVVDLATDAARLSSYDV